MRKAVRFVRGTVALLILLTMLLLPLLVIYAIVTGKLSSGADTSISEVFDGPGGCAVIDDWSTAGNCDEPVEPVEYTGP